MEKAGQTARTAVRRLQELENEKLIEVQYRKGHAYYRFLDSPEDLIKRGIAWFDGLSTTSK